MGSIEDLFVLSIAALHGDWKGRESCTMPTFPPFSFKRLGGKANII
jgi:hypothetical protein